MSLPRPSKAESIKIDRWLNETKFGPMSWGPKNKSGRDPAPSTGSPSPGAITEALSVLPIILAKPEDDFRKSLLDRAQSVLSTDASAAAKKNIKNNLEELSAILFLEWLVGEKRFESQSQQTEYWLSRCY